MEILKNMLIHKHEKNFYNRSPKLLSGFMPGVKQQNLKSMRKELKISGWLENRLENATFSFQQLKIVLNDLET